MSKPSLSEVVDSETPYLDVFGTDVRTKGRPTGAAHVHSQALELPNPADVPDRLEAQSMRNRVKHRAIAVLTALHPEELRKIYRAELLLELQRSAETDPGRPGRQLVRPLTDEEVKATPGSGFAEGETYWEWMKTYTSKSDEQWAAEKPAVQANMKRIRKGGRNAG